MCVSAQKGYGEVSLMDCMRLFTKEDVLDGDEKPVSNASKKVCKCSYYVCIDVCVRSFTQFVSCRHAAGVKPGGDALRSSPSRSFLRS